MGYFADRPLSLIHPFDVQQTAKFVRQCKKEGAFHVAGLILFMSQTGARVGEAVALEWPEVDVPARTALLLKTKTETNYTRHLTDVFVTRLDLRQRRSKKNPNRVFHYKCRFAVNKRIKSICARAEIDTSPATFAAATPMPTTRS